MPDDPTRTRAETDLEEAAETALRAWLTVALAEAVTPSAVNPTIVLSFADLWREGVDTGIVPIVRRVWRTRFEQVAGYPPAVSLIDEYMRMARNRMVRVPDEVAARIHQIVARNITASIPEISALVHGELEYTGTENWPHRATVIARTECLPGDAPVTAGRVTAAYRRFHDGEWVTVRLRSGKELSGTPNHPMLTQRGWVGLGELTEHDRVVYHRDQVNRFGTPGDHDVQTRPPSIREIFDALSAVGIVERKHTAEPDFHGDGAEGYVDVARPDGVLLVGEFAAVNQTAVEGVLPGTDARDVALAALGVRFDRGLPIAKSERLLRAAHRHSGLVEALPDGAVADAELVRDALSRPSELILLHDVVEWQVRPKTRMPRVPELALAGVGAAAHNSGLLDNPQDGGLIPPRFAGNGRAAFPGEIQLDDVATVRIGHYAGHVYNLTTLDGYFNTHSYYTGNTGGAWNGAAWMAHSQSPDADILVKSWLATDDDRTRRTHRDIDGHTVPLGEPFIVGGFPMQYPLDPRGPANQVIQCRCSLTFAEAAQQLPIAASARRAEFARNWVERCFPGGHLPSLIRRIADHIMGSGRSESAAIAAAVNAVKETCQSGDVNWPGIQEVNPGYRAEACAAVAEWEAGLARVRSGAC